MFMRVLLKDNTVFDLFEVHLFAGTYSGFLMQPVHETTCGKPFPWVGSIGVMCRQLVYLCHIDIVVIPGAQPASGRFNPQ